MGLRTEEREIDGLSVTTTQLPPVRALVLSRRLLPIIGPIMASGGSLDTDALAAALDKLDDAATVQLLIKTLANTTVKLDGEIHTLGTEERINAAFAGRFATMLSVAWFAIEVNFFPGGVDALVESASRVKASR